MSYLGWREGNPNWLRGAALRDLPEDLKVLFVAVKSQDDGADFNATPWHVHHAYEIEGADLDAIKNAADPPTALRNWLDTVVPQDHAKAAETRANSPVVPVGDQRNGSAANQQIKQWRRKARRDGRRG